MDVGPLDAELRRRRLPRMTTLPLPRLLTSADAALVLALPVALAGARYGALAGTGAGVAAGLLQGALWLRLQPGELPVSPALSGAVLALIGGLVGQAVARERAQRLAVARHVWTSLRAGQVGEFLSYVLYQLREYQISATSLVESLALSVPKDHVIADKVERLRRVVSELNGKAARLLGENSAPTARRSRPGDFEVGELVRQAAAEAQIAFASAPVRIAIAELDGPLKANGDMQALHLSLLAVLQNSLEACSERRQGSISIVVRKRESSAEIEILDDAGGPLVDQTTLFEPFYSARSGSAGMGLGLSMSRRMVDRLGGTVRVKTKPGALAVLIDFPLRRDLPFVRNDETTWARRRSNI